MKFKPQDLFGDITSEVTGAVTGAENVVISAGEGVVSTVQSGLGTLASTGEGVISAANSGLTTLENTGNSAISTISAGGSALQASLQSSGVASLPTSIQQEFEGALSTVSSAAGNIVQGAENVPGTVSQGVATIYQAASQESTTITKALGALPAAVVTVTAPAVNVVQGAAGTAAADLSNIPGDLTNIQKAAVTAVQSAGGTITSAVAPAASTVVTRLGMGVAGEESLWNTVLPVAANTAVVATAGVVSIPAELWDIGWNAETTAAAIATGTPLSQVKKSNLAAGWQTAFLGDVKSTTGYQANTSEFQQMGAQYGPVGSFLGTLVDQAILQPVYLVPEVGVIAGAVNIATMVPATIETAYGDVTGTTTVSCTALGTAGNWTTAQVASCQSCGGDSLTDADITSKDAAYTTFVACLKSAVKTPTATANTNLTTAQWQQKLSSAPATTPATTKKQGTITTVPTNNPACSGHIVGSKESIEAGCG